MRVLFANATQAWGGEKSWALETALCMQRRGRACLMVGRPGDRWLAECAARGLEVREVRFGPTIFDPRPIGQLLRIVRAHRPDCIAVNISRDMIAGVVAGARLRVPVVRHVGLSEDLNHDPVDWLIHRFGLAGTISVGHRMKQEMLGEYRWLRPDQVEVIHIGKDTGVFRPGRSDALRQAWRLAGDAVLLGVTSQLEESKGHALLLDALHRLGHQEIHLAIVGEGSHREFLVRRAEALGLGGRVHFLGFSRALPDLLRCLDGFVLPSLSEGFPNTLVEAMATGLPCVATRVCGIPEIIEHGRTGLLVEAGDGEGLAAALKTLVADPTLRASLGSQARQRVEAAFGLEAATDRFEAYLRAIIADGRGRAGWWGAR